LVGFRAGFFELLSQRRNVTLRTFERFMIVFATRLQVVESRLV